MAKNRFFSLYKIDIHKIQGFFCKIVIHRLCVDLNKVRSRSSFAKFMSLAVGVSYKRRDALEATHTGKLEADLKNCYGYMKSTEELKMLSI